MGGKDVRDKAVVKLYTRVVTVELVALVPMCDLTALWLWLDQERRLTLAPTVWWLLPAMCGMALLILVETFFLQQYRKRGHLIELWLSGRVWHWFLLSMTILLAGLWLVYWCGLYWLERQGIGRGTEAYTLYLRPGMYGIGAAIFSVLTVRLYTDKGKG